MFALPDAETPQTVADWIELELASGEASLSKTKVGSIVESETGSEPREAFLTDVWRQLEERQARYTKKFFRCEGDLAIRSLAAEVTAQPEYIACLLFSLYGVDDEYRLDPKIFERLSAEAIKNYIQGKVFVFGWPVLPNIETDIGLRVKAVASAAKERFVESPAARYKDRGVDVIAWKPFLEHDADEHRSSQVVILAQCAAGGNWRKKTTELPYQSWIQYIHWARDPQTAIVVPRVISADLWHDISREGGVVFDRIRIVNLLPDGVSEADLKDAIETWISDQIKESRA